MVRQLVQRPFAIAPALLGANAQVSVSPNGKYVLVCNEAANPTLYQWTGTNYVVVSGAVSTSGKIAYSGAWSADGLFLLLQTNTTLQLRSFNDATGATTVLDDTVAARAASTIRHFFDDHYVGVRTRTSAGVIAEWYKHDRATNKLTRITSYTSGANSSIMAFAVLKSKKSLFIAWRNDNGNSVRVCYFNETAGSFTFAAVSSLESSGSNVTTVPIDVAVSDDENFWFRVGNDQAVRNRAGTIAADGRSITVGAYDSTTLGEDATLTAFVFGSKAVLRGKGESGVAPFDTYNLFNNGVYSANSGQILPMENRDVGFSRYYPSGSKDSSTTANKVWAFLSRTDGVPSVSVYQEVLSNDTIDISGTGPMGDAFSSMIVDGSVRFFAQGVMGDAYSIIGSNDTSNLLGIGPIAEAWGQFNNPESVAFGGTGLLGDATFRTVGQNFVNLAVAPMGEAWVDIGNTYVEAFEAQGIMGDASLTTVEFDNIEFIAQGPMGDATITFSPQWAFFETDGIMGDAVFEIPNVYIPEMFAQGPMGDAVFEIPNVYVKSLFAQGLMGNATVQITGRAWNFVAQGPMGDAVFEIPNVYVNSLYAQGPMGEASVDLNNPPHGDLIAIGPMGEAAVSFLTEDFVCRRRSMMLIQEF